MNFKVSFFESNGAKIRYALYQNQELERVKHYIFLLPGRAEYIEKYASIKNKLKIPSETVLVILDHRGQGLSEGSPFHISSYDEFCFDLKVLIKKLVTKKQTYSMIGCSMGGLITCYGTLKGDFSPKKVFLSCPLMGLAKSSPWYGATFLLSGFLHFSGLGKKHWREYKLSKTFEKNLLTENIEHYESLKNPLYEPKEGTFSWIFATLKALFYVNLKADAKKLGSKVVFCVATNELIVSNEAIYRFIKKLQKSSSSLVNLHSFKTKHELFFDKEEETDRFFKVLNVWMDSSSKSVGS